MRQVVTDEIHLPDTVWEPTRDYLYGVDISSTGPRMQGGLAYIPPPLGTVKIACKVANIDDDFWDWYHNVMSYLNPLWWFEAHRLSRDRNGKS